MVAHTLDVSQDEPLQFLQCLIPVAIVVGILVAAVFLDTMGPVMQARAKSAALMAAQKATTMPGSAGT